MSYNIAIDGPAGAGKSTIARRVAKEKKFIYIDTGAMYRATAYYFFRHGLSPEKEADVEQACSQIEISIQYEQGEQIVLLNGENVNSYLRTEEVGNGASVVAALPRVRQMLLDTQRKLAKENDCVMDGRDIGTCVLPEADCKIYLTASARTRAKRRFDELSAKGEICNLEQIERDILERDKRDMEREISPLKKAEDAHLVDSSELTIDEVTEKILSLCTS